MFLPIAAKLSPEDWVEIYYKLDVHAPPTDSKQCILKTIGSEGKRATTEGVYLSESQWNVVYSAVSTALEETRFTP